MDASKLTEETKRKEEEEARASFYPKAETHKSTLEAEIKGADELYYKFVKEQKQKASTAPQQQKGDTKPEGLKGVLFKRDEQERIENERKRIADEQERNANAAIEQAQIEANAILAAEAARIAAEEARIAAEMKAKEDEETKNWWGARLDWTGIPLGNQGGGKNGKKKSKRMIKIKNAKNKSKSKSQSRRQRQKRRRHSRRV